MRHSFVFDQNRCTGCGACRLACTIENRLPLQQSWRQIHTFNPVRYPAAPLLHLSLACNHCARATCMMACPAKAFFRDAVTGVVLLDQEKCIGCRYCTWACPFDAPKFDRNTRVMTKCTFCIERLQGGMEPACATLCPTGALSYGELDEEEIFAEAIGFPQSSFKPAVRIVPWDGGMPRDVCDASVVPMPLRSSREETRISLQSEWPLLSFTFIVAALFGALAARVAGGVGVSLPVFLGTAALGMLVSGKHLGRKERAWRSVLNVTQSWLSREVLFVSLFLLCGAAYLAVTPCQAVLGWTAVGLGLLALFSIDMVYRFSVRSGLRIPHSASLVLTGPLLAGVLLLDPAFGVLFGVSKLGLYAVRKVTRARDARDWHPWATVVRVGVGFVAPGIIWAMNAEEFGALVIVCVLLGEFVDRAEFYAELELVSPQRQMHFDLARLLAVNPATGTRSSTQPAQS